MIHKKYSKFTIQDKNIWFNLKTFVAFKKYNQYNNLNIRLYKILSFSILITLPIYFQIILMKIINQKLIKNEKLKVNYNQIDHPKSIYYSMILFYLLFILNTNYQLMNLNRNMSFNKLKLLWMQNDNVNDKFLQKGILFKTQTQDNMFNFDYQFESFKDKKQKNISSYCDKENDPPNEIKFEKKLKTIHQISQTSNPILHNSSQIQQDESQKENHLEKSESQLSILSQNLNDSIMVNNIEVGQSNQVIGKKKMKISSDDFYSTKINQQTQQYQLFNNCKNNQIESQDIISNSEQKTTIMLRHIPNRFNQDSLMEIIDIHFKGTYDFIYLPMDFKNNCSIGYAFINFIDYSYVNSFYQMFNDQQLDPLKSSKICIVNFARIQGRESLIQHFKKSIIMHLIADCRYKPLIFPNPLTDVYLF